MVAHPEEVIIIIVEDYVTPQDLASEFDKAGFADLVYTGNPSPPWPTLRQLIESGRRVLVFTESGGPVFRGFTPRLRRSARLLIASTR